MKKCDDCGELFPFITENGIRKPIHNCKHKPYTNLKSYTRPYKCKCGAEVFYYRSEHDGRVVFDELGPPWPLHQCNVPHVIIGSYEDRGLIPALIVNLDPNEGSQTMGVRLLAGPKQTLACIIPHDVGFQLTRFNNDAPIFMKHITLQNQAILTFYTQLSKPISHKSNERIVSEFSFKAVLQRKKRKRRKK